MRHLFCCSALFVAACAGHAPVLASDSSGTSALAANVGAAKTDIQRAIKAERDAWNVAFARRDTAALGAQWAPTGTLSTGAGTWQGREEIVREHYASLFSGRPDISFTRTTDRVAGHDGWHLVYETGRWIEKWSERDGVTELRGAYFTMWRRARGRWRKLSEIFVPDYCAGSTYCAPRPERPTH